MTAFTITITGNNLDELRQKAEQLLGIPPTQPDPELPSKGYCIYLTKVGTNKPQVVKAVRNIMGLSTRLARDLVDKVESSGEPEKVVEMLSEVGISEAASQLAEAGAGVSVY